MTQLNIYTYFNFKHLSYNIWNEKYVDIIGTSYTNIIYLKSQIVAGAVHIKLDVRDSMTSDTR